MWWRWLSAPQQHVFGRDFWRVSCPAAATRNIAWGFARARDQWSGTQPDQSAPLSGRPDPPRTPTRVLLGHDVAVTRRGIRVDVIYTMFITTRVYYCYVLSCFPRDNSRVIWSAAVDQESQSIASRNTCNICYICSYYTLLYIQCTCYIDTRYTHNIYVSFPHFLNSCQVK